MLNEILNEYEKVREKDKATKKNTKELIKGLKSELLNLEKVLESSNDMMNVITNYIYIFYSIHFHILGL